MFTDDWYEDNSRHLNHAAKFLFCSINCSKVYEDYGAFCKNDSKLKNVGDEIVTNLWQCVKIDDTMEIAKLDTTIVKYTLSLLPQIENQLEEVFESQSLRFREGAITFLSCAIHCIECLKYNDWKLVAKSGQSILSYIDEYVHCVNLPSSGYSILERFARTPPPVARVVPKVREIDDEFVRLSPIYVAEKSNQEILLTYLRDNKLSAVDLNNLRDLSFGLGILPVARGLA